VLKKHPILGAVSQEFNSIPGIQIFVPELQWILSIFDSIPDFGFLGSSVGTCSVLASSSMVGWWL